jgi:hypothetical protein
MSCRLRRPAADLPRVIRSMRDRGRRRRLEPPRRGCWRVGCSSPSTAAAPRRCSLQTTTGCAEPRTARPLDRSRHRDVRIRHVDRRTCPFSAPIFVREHDSSSADSATEERHVMPTRDCDRSRQSVVQTTSTRSGTHSRFVRSERRCRSRRNARDQRLGTTRHGPRREYGCSSPCESATSSQRAGTVMSRTERRTATNVARSRPASGPHAGENLAYTRRPT